MCDRAPKRHCLENSRAPRCFTGEGPDHLRTHEDPSRVRGHGSLGSLRTAGQRALGVAAANDATSGGRGGGRNAKACARGAMPPATLPGRTGPSSTFTKALGIYNRHCTKMMRIRKSARERSQVPAMVLIFYAENKVFMFKGGWGRWVQRKNLKRDSVKG